MRRFALLALDFCAELAEHYVWSYGRRKLQLHILEARICMLERQADAVLERARRDTRQDRRVA
jgi:hypothetical protein